MVHYIYIYIKSCIICQQCCHVLSDASDIVTSFDVSSVAISHQQHCHASFDASNVVMCHLMPLKKQKQILGGEKLCSGKRSLVAMVTRTQIAVDKCCHSIHILCISSSYVVILFISFYSYPVYLFIVCCHSIHILCISSWYVVILFISCVSPSYVVILFISCVSLHGMLSFYSYPVYLFMVCCHSIHILCISIVVILFISCVSLHGMLSFYSYPVYLFMVCCHSIHILCGSSSFVILFRSYVSLHHMCRMLCCLSSFCYSVHI